jgi:hypothetical protein
LQAQTVCRRCQQGCCLFLSAYIGRRSACTCCPPPLCAAQLRVLREKDVPHRPTRLCIRRCQERCSDMFSCVIFRVFKTKKGMKHLRIYKLAVVVTTAVWRQSKGNIVPQPRVMGLCCSAGQRVPCTTSMGASQQHKSSLPPTYAESEAAEHTRVAACKVARQRLWRGSVGVTQ